MKPSATAPHGTNNRYNHGACRCDLCRAAHTQWQREWRRRGRVMVDAKAARRHLRRLARLGVGHRAVAYACDVDRNAVQSIRQGRQRRIWAVTEARILAVDEGARLDSSKVDSRRVVAAITELRRIGITGREIAERLGYRRLGIDFLIRGRPVYARTELRVLRLAREIQTELAADRAIDPVCPGCGLSHAPAARVARLRRFESATFTDAYETWPCIYPDGDAGRQLFARDMRAVQGRPREAARRKAA